MHKVELSLADWLDLYNRLLAAERLLAAAEGTADHHAIRHLRAEVAHLQADVDHALQAVTAEMQASKGRVAL